MLSESWDCVATCFFIDTAHNVLEYMETIWKILKPGGVWINLGEWEWGKYSNITYCIHVVSYWVSLGCINQVIYEKKKIDYSLISWLWLGPLLYHYENMANEFSVELCYEDIKAAMIKFGFYMEVSYVILFF